MRTRSSSISSRTIGSSPPRTELATGPVRDTVRVNRLADATSPYLLQHADNPVDWFPWGDEALSKAACRGPSDLPLDRIRRLSLVPRDGAGVLRGRGNVAAFLNANFVPIKVDREERPDLDSIYMDAVQSMTGRGRMAAVRVPHARREALLRRDLLPEGARPWDAVVPPGAGGDRRGMARAARPISKDRAAGSSTRSPVRHR